MKSLGPVSSKLFNINATHVFPIDFVVTSTTFFFFFTRLVEFICENYSSKRKKGIRTSKPTNMLINVKIYKRAFSGEV